MLGLFVDGGSSLLLFNLYIFKKYLSRMELSFEDTNPLMAHEGADAALDTKWYVFHICRQHALWKSRPQLANWFDLWLGSSVMLGSHFT